MAPPPNAGPYTPIFVRSDRPKWAFAAAVGHVRGDSLTRQGVLAAMGCPLNRKNDYLAIANRLVKRRSSSEAGRIVVE
jgi:hypothetical protein